MKEYIIKCSKITFAGDKKAGKWILNNMKIQGVGPIVCQMMEEAFSMNKSLTRRHINLDDFCDLDMSNHNSIKIVDIGKKEMKVALYDENENLQIGITFVSLEKIVPTDLKSLFNKYSKI